jgi:hypothetical protein
MAESVLLTIQGDIRDIKSKFSQVEGAVKKLSRTTKTQTNMMSKQFQGVGNIMHAVMGAVVVRKFTQGLTAAAKAASDLESQTAKFKTVFRGSLDVANKDVETLRENFAMSEREARQYMAAVQDLLVPMGMARNEAAALSGGIVKLSADLGSFNKMPTEQVMMNIQAALTGQYRAMRKYGVVLLDTDVRQRAVNDGLANSSEEVTALQKAMTAYKMILEQTTDAQGDMARTFDEYANVQKRTNAALEDFKASVGKNVTPALGFWKLQLVKILELTTDVMDIYNKEAVEVASGQDKIKQKIVEVRMEQEKYKKIIESRWRIDSEKQSAQETLNELLEKEAWLQNKLNLLIKNGKNWYYEQTEAKKKDAEATKELNLAMAEFSYIWGGLELTKEQEALIDKFGQMPEFYTEEGLEAQREYYELQKDVNQEMSSFQQFAIGSAGALGGFVTQLASGEKNAYSMSRAVQRLAFQLAALAAVSFIGGSWGQFAGGFLGMLGAPAPSPIRKPKVKTQNQTIGQKRQNVTMSTPMYGRRFIQEMNKNAVNVDSITAWSLG